MILARLFGDQSVGCYVDIGAHHPSRYSNTYHFYRRGWSGVNIDAMPNSMTAFRELRPRDVNIEIGVGERAGLCELILFNESALNTLDRTVADARRHDTAFYVTGTKLVTVKPLSAILGDNLRPGQVIDFLTVDVEGMDLNVLRSNDWNRFRPRYVLAEAFGTLNVEAALRTPLAEYMQQRDYVLVAKTVNTCIFGDKSRRGPAHDA
jgi:FkbM family methyltransferase